MSPGQDETRVCGYILFIITIIAEKAFRRCFSGEWGEEVVFSFAMQWFCRSILEKGRYFSAALMGGN